MRVVLDLGLRSVADLARRRAAPRRGRHTAHLGQAVRDVHDGDAGGLQLGDDLEQPLVSVSVRLEVGSSMITIRRSSDSALAISTSWRWASDSSGNRRVGSKSTPSRSSRGLRPGHAARPVDQPQPPARTRFAAEKMFAATSRLSDRLSSW